MPLGQLLINHFKRHNFYEKYKNALKKLITSSFFYKIFLKIVFKQIP